MPRCDLDTSGPRLLPWPGGGCRQTGSAEWGAAPAPAGGPASSGILLQGPNFWSTSHGWQRFNLWTGGPACSQGGEAELAKTGTLRRNQERRSPQVWVPEAEAGAGGA